MECDGPWIFVLWCILLICRLLCIVYSSVCPVIFVHPFAGNRIQACRKKSLVASQPAFLSASSEFAQGGGICYKVCFFQP